MTYGYCVYHEIECDYKGDCVNCPHNTEKDTEWFKQDDERIEREVIKMTEKNKRKMEAKKMRSVVGLGVNLGTRTMEKSKKAQRRADKIALRKEW